MTSIDFSSLSVGDELPQLSIDISAKLIVGAAIASRDYQNVHHDKDAAQELGSPDIFMNILTTNGLVGRYVTDWSGPSARLRKVAIKLGAPNYPGDCMVMSGKVAALDTAAATVELEVLGKNQYGNHVMGSVVVEL